MKNDNKKFNSDSKFNKELLDQLKILIDDKLPDFLEFCILTRNFNPIKNLFEIFNHNHF